MAKSFPDQMPKQIIICKWISFAILTFVIGEETPSVHVFVKNLFFPEELQK